MIEVTWEHIIAADVVAYLLNKKWSNLDQFDVAYQKVIEEQIVDLVRQSFANYGFRSAD